MAQGANVRVGQVHDVDVIANRRAVGRGVIFAEDRDLRRFLYRRLQDAWDQMGFGIVVLATFFGGARGVEVAQGDKLQAVGDVEGMQQLLQEKFRPAVGIYRPLPFVFGDGDVLGISVGGGGGREDHAADSG